MALCHLLLNSSFASKKLLCSFSPFTRLEEQHLRWVTHHHQIPPCSRGLVFACSAKKSRVRRKSKPSRSIKSNVELCNELREFLSIAGLPENHVPSTKELSAHGRKDLANIVRRRGYRVITDLMNSGNGDTDSERNSGDIQDLGQGHGNESPEGQDRDLDASAEGASLPSGSCAEENVISGANGAITINMHHQSNESLESSMEPLHEVAMNFVKNGKLDTIQDVVVSQGSASFSRKQYPSRLLLHTNFGSIH